NEANLCNWWRGSNQEYRDLILKPGFDAIKARRPNALVGGPASTEVASWDNLLEENGLLVRKLDFLSVHTWGAVSDVKTKIDNGVATINNRRICTADGYCPPGFWILFGYGSGPPYTGDICSVSWSDTPGDAINNIMNYC